MAHCLQSEIDQLSFLDEQQKNKMGQSPRSLWPVSIKRFVNRQSCFTEYVHFLPMMGASDGMYQKIQGQDSSSTFMWEETIFAKSCTCLEGNK